jgi:2-polyprenyl-6-methoxyphenol hydroxylase-like FAD-dependent oxidoreductase
MIRPRARKVLVCGASIAGPALAWWLERYGFDVTVVERAGTIRSGGYAIDIRGTAVDVCERMGLMPALRVAHINAQSWAFRNSRRVISSIRQEDITGGVVGRDVEVQRGVISGLLHDLTTDTIPYRFDDSVIAMADHDGGIDVTFRSGRQERFDLVIAADGLHSTTRALAFGPADQFYRYLGCCFVGFTMPSNHGFSREAVIYNEPGLMALVYETGAERMNALLAYRREAPAREEYTDMDRLHRGGDRVGDVVELQIEEDRQAEMRDLVHPVAAMRAEELEPEFHPADMRLDLAHQRLGRLELRNIEREIDRIAHSPAPPSVLALSAAGFEVYETIAPMVIEITRKLMSVLSEEEEQVLEKLILRLAGEGLERMGEGV